ncbi:hypothetical protein Tco_1270519 [Tanacetum coccineum]
MIMVVLVEEVYVEALQVKYLIIDWGVYSEDTRKYWKIIRVRNHTKAYQTFDDMLKKFDRYDLDKLWSLVKETFSSIDPTDDKERTLWVELKRLFEHDTDDILWKLQRCMHDPFVRKLYETCGVYHVSSVRGHDIFMYEYIRNHKKTIKNKQTRTRERKSEQKPEAKARKSQTSSQSWLTEVNHKGQNPKYSTLVLQVSEKSTNGVIKSIHGIVNKMAGSNGSNQSISLAPKHQSHVAMEKAQRNEEFALHSLTKLAQAVTS